MCSAVPAEHGPALAAPPGGSQAAARVTSPGRCAARGFSGDALRPALHSPRQHAPARVPRLREKPRLAAGAQEGAAHRVQLRQLRPCPAAGLRERCQLPAAAAHLALRVRLPGLGLPLLIRTQAGRRLWAGCQLGAINLPVTQEALLRAGFCTTTSSCCKTSNPMVTIVPPRWGRTFRLPEFVFCMCRQLTGTRASQICNAHSLAPPDVMRDCMGQHLIDQVESVLSLAGPPAHQSVPVPTTTASPPLQANILEAIAWLVQDCTTLDSLVFAFSGRGCQPPHSSGGSWDEAILPCDFQEVSTGSLHPVCLLAWPPALVTPGQCRQLCLVSWGLPSDAQKH